MDEIRDPSRHFWNSVQLCEHSKSAAIKRYGGNTHARPKRCQLCCWPWMGAIQVSKDRNLGGYGVVRFHGRVQRAARVAFEIFFDVELGVDQVLRVCDLSKCCNPTHYERIGPSGDRHYRYGTFGLDRGFEYDVVEEIYERWVGGETQQNLAREYDTPQSNISRLVNRFRQHRGREPQQAALKKIDAV